MHRSDQHAASRTTRSAPGRFIDLLGRIAGCAGHSLDPLTGLPTRKSFEAALARQNSAVLLLDIDRLRAVNEALGRTAGDRVLCEIAARLDGIAARVGGDEFAILLPDTPIEDAERLARQLISDAAVPIQLSTGEPITISAGVGIAIGCGPAVLDQAEAAMYRAKAHGSGRHAVFDADMRFSAIEHLRVSQEIQQAFDLRQLSLHYEPIISLTDRRVAGFEALLRWQHPTRGLISFGPYIPAAESSGLIVPLGRQVITDACRQLAEWHSRCPDDTVEPLSLSVNVSGRQLADPDFLDHLKLVLLETAIDPESLKLEITESVMMHDNAENVLWRVKDLGVSLHMDDFGTGYSSLSRLHRFPVDVVKIDRSFVKNTTARRDYAAVLHAIVTLAHNLGMEVTAEGVETSGQLSLIEALDADYAQGYFFSRSMPPAQAELFLHSHQPVAC